MRKTTRLPLPETSLTVPKARGREQAVQLETKGRAAVDASHDQAMGVLESITDAFIALDRDWRVTYANAEAERLNRMGRADMLGKSFWELFPEAVDTHVQTEVLRAARERVSVEFESRSAPGDRWFHAKAYPAKDGALAIFYEEITEQKRAEQSLRQQDKVRELDCRKWRDLFFQGPTGVCLLRGPDHVFESHNAEYLRLAGRSGEELVGRPVRDAMPEIVSQGYLGILDRVYQTGDPYTGREAKVQLDPAGTGVGDLDCLYVNFVCLAMRDDAGQVDGIFIHAVDVTDLVKVRHRIEEANQRFGLALTATHGLVYEWEPRSGRVVRERGLEDLTGWRESEVPPTIQWWYEQVHPEDVEQMDGKSISAASHMRLLTYRVRHRNGNWIWIEDHAVLHRDANDQLLRVVGFMVDITARRQAQQEVRQSQERFQAAVRAVSDLVWTSNARGQMEGEQAAWGAFTGQSYADYQGDGWSKAVHPDDAQPTLDAWNRAVSERKNFVFEHRVRRSDAVWRLFSVRAVPVLDSQGAVREWVGVHTDITDQRQTEEAVRQSGERFRELAESMPQVVWTATPDGVYDYVNARWTDLTGCDLAATQAGAFRVDMLPDDLALMDRNTSLGLAAGEPYSFECRFFRVADRSRRWHLVRAVPVLNGVGQVTKWLGTSTDTDDQKQALEALRLSEWRLRFTLQAANFGSWDLDLRNLHAHRSPRYDAILGYDNPLPDWTHAQFLEHVFPEDRDAVHAKFQASLVEGGEWNVECRILRASDRTTRWIWAYGKTIVDASGKPANMLGLISDITDRKEAEGALAQANGDLTRANSDLEQFAYSASHDLQEPLRSVMIYSELLSTRYAEKLDGQALEFLTFLQKGASRMEILVHDLLAYTRVKTLDEPVERTDAAPILEAALAKLANSIDESGAKITHGILPAVKIYHVHLEQLFLNIIGNALKYRGVKRPLIHVAAEKRDMQWLFSIRDNGIGINPQHRERIFGIFKRLHTGDEYPGTGIGLAICQRIAERYGGRIWVESEPGGGSAFCFTLPG